MPPEETKLETSTESTDQQAAGQEETPSAVVETPAAVSQIPQSDYSAEAAWLRQQMSEQVSRMQQLQSELEDYEKSAMTDEEAAEWELQKREQTITEQQQRLAEQLYATDLYAYYSAFVPAGVIKGNDPSEWQDSVLRHLTGENTRLKTEVDRLRKAVKPGAGVEKVSAPAGTKASRKTLWEYTPQERERLFQMAQEGLIKAEDYPPLE